MKNTTRENLSEHSHDCAIIAHALGVIAVKVFGKTHINPEKCAVYAIYHDAPEILTGDLPTPVKYFNPEIKKAYQNVELCAKKNLIEMLDDTLSKEYEEILSPKGEEGDFVHFADKICAYLKCIEEIKSGNREFVVAKEQIYESLVKLSSCEVDYFLENYAKPFEMSLDEISRGM